MHVCMYVCISVILWFSITKKDASALKALEKIRENYRYHDALTCEKTAKFVCLNLVQKMYGS